ncbi:flagellar hook-length control protein FliK [bacterium]|nr:flagellar hook-length control protein FliK [bacterium]
MAANMDVSLLIGEPENKSYLTCQTDQPQIKSFKADTEFKNILHEQIENVNKEKNFSSQKEDVIEREETKLDNDNENVKSDTEQKPQTEDNKTEDKESDDSDSNNENVEKEVKDDVSSTNAKKDDEKNNEEDEEDVTRQNSQETILDVLPDDDAADKIIVKDDAAMIIDPAQDAVNPENTEAILETAKLNITGAEDTAEDTVKISANDETGILNSGNETEKDNAADVNELLNSKELNPQDMPVDKHNEPKTGQIHKTEINQTLNNELQPSVDLTKQSEIAEKTAKLSTPSKNNNKKIILDKSNNNEQVVPSKQNQDGLDLSFSQEQSSDSPLSGKNFSELTGKIVTEEKDVLKDETLKDFTLVTEQQDTTAKTKTLKVAAEIKESNFNEIFQQKVNAHEIIKQVQSKFNLRTAGDMNYSEIRFRLNPDNLGEVSMKITMENNTLTARMRVQNEAVKEVFEANFAELKKALNNQGVKIEKIEVTLKNDTSNMGSFAESNFTNDGTNKGTNNLFSRFSGRSNDNEQNNDNNITLTSSNRRDRINSNDGHVDYLA